MKRIKVRVTIGPSSLLKMTNHWLVLWLMNSALQAKKKKPHANVKKLQAESKNLPSKILQYRYICKFHVYSAGKVFLPIFSWPSKAMRHIKHLHHTGGRKYKQQGSLWKSVVCMKMSGSSLQTHRAGGNMHRCKCTSRAVPHEHVPDYLKTKWKPCIHGQWVVPQLWHTYSDFYCRARIGSPSQLVFAAPILLARLFFLFAPSAWAFFIAAAVITPKNLMIIASQSNQSHNIPIERRATAWGDTLWSRKTNQEGGGGLIYPSWGSTTQGIIKKCLTSIANSSYLLRSLEQAWGKRG